MQCDTAKLPAKKWLSLSQAINFLAFGEPRDEEAMERDGYPSDKTYAIRIARALIRCRKEAGTKPKFSEFVKTVGKKGRLVQNYPISTRLRECEAAWPPSGRQLYDLVMQWEQEQVSDEKKRAGAEQTMENALLSGEVDFEGHRDGKPELIDIDFIKDDDDTVVWMKEGLAAKSRVDGPILIWAEVRVERASFVKWLAQSTPVEESRASAQPLKSPSTESANPPREKKRRGRPPRYTPECEAAARRIAAEKKASTKPSDNTDTALIAAFQNWHENKYPGEAVPVRQTVRDWLSLWGL